METPTGPTDPSGAARGLSEWARRRPDAPAVGDGSDLFTFAELDARVATLARSLLERIGPFDHRVATAIPVLVERSLDSVVALHGLWRAGIPAAPIDATWPRALVGETIARLGTPPVAVVTTTDARATLPSGIEAVVVPTVAGDGVGPQAVNAPSPAMVVFTSGSTGRPKGVVLSWEMLDDILTGPVLAGVDDHARCAVVSPLHWRGGINRVLAPSQGAFLLVVPDGNPDPTAAFDLADRWRITHLPAVPSHLTAAAARWPHGRRIESVEVLRPFAESLRWDDVPALRAILAPHARIVTSYGASETSAGLVEYTIASDTPIGHGRVPLGVPTRPDRLRLEPLPGPDAPHDRLQIVATHRVATGYLGDPDLTATRFGTDPDGTRWWRSGDLVRRDDDGCLHHTGRVDDMVKIRGRLVEPSEAERALHEIHGIAAAAVVPRPTDRGPVRLVGHLVLDPDSDLTSERVRATLISTLPPYLVPSPLVLHEQLPRTESGKIDRVALRAAAAEPWRAGPPREPVDNLEAALAVISAEVLGLDSVAPDDDLWELGLDSLAAVEMAAAASELGWGPLTPTALLEHPTPAAVAQMLRQSRRHHDPARASAVVFLNPRGERAPLVVLPGAGGTALACRGLARALGPDQPVLVVEPRGLHAPGVPARTIEAMAADVVEAIHAHARARPVIIVGHSAGGIAAYAAAQRLDGQQIPVAAVMLDTPFPGMRRSQPRPGAPQPTWTRRARLAARHPLMAIRRIRSEIAIAVRVRRPGRPSTSEARYAAFRHISVAAVRNYHPEPAAFPILLLHPDDSLAPATWAGWPSIETRAVRGDHLGMLRTPVVDDVATEVLAFIERIRAESSVA